MIIVNMNGGDRGACIWIRPRMMNKLIDVAAHRTPSYMVYLATNMTGGLYIYRRCEGFAIRLPNFSKPTHVPAQSMLNNLKNTKNVLKIYEADSI